jgi:hypothetical protein
VRDADGVRPCKGTCDVQVNTDSPTGAKFSKFSYVLQCHL